MPKATYRGDDLRISVDGEELQKPNFDPSLLIDHSGKAKTNFEPILSLDPGGRTITGLEQRLAGMARPFLPDGHPFPADLKVEDGTISLTGAKEQLQGLRDAIAIRLHLGQKLQLTEQQRVRMEVLAGLWDDYNVAHGKYKSVPFDVVEVEQVGNLGFEDGPYIAHLEYHPHSMSKFLHGGTVQCQMALGELPVDDEDIFRWADKRRSGPRTLVYIGLPLSTRHTRVEVETRAHYETTDLDGTMSINEDHPANSFLPGTLWGGGDQVYDSVDITEYHRLECVDELIQHCEKHPGHWKDTILWYGAPYDAVDIMTGMTDDQTIQWAEAHGANYACIGDLYGIELEPLAYGDHTRWPGHDNPDEDMYFVWLETLDWTWGNCLHGYQKFEISHDPKVMYEDWTAVPYTHTRDLYGFMGCPYGGPPVWEGVEPSDEETLRWLG